MSDNKSTCMNNYNNGQTIENHIKGIKGEIGYSSDQRIAAWQRLQCMFIHWGYILSLVEFGIMNQ